MEVGNRQLKKKGKEGNTMAPSLFWFTRKRKAPANWLWATKRSCKKPMERNIYNIHSGKLKLDRKLKLEIKLRWSPKLLPLQMAYLKESKFCLQILCSKRPGGRRTIWSWHKPYSKLCSVLQQLILVSIKRNWRQPAKQFDKMHGWKSRPWKPTAFQS